METFLRPPLLMYRRMHNIYVVTSQRFTTRSGPKSFGFKSSQEGSRDDTDNHYRDKRLQKLWNETYERIASMQSHNSQSSSTRASLGQQEDAQSISGANTRLRSSRLFTNELPKVMYSHKAEPKSNQLPKMFNMNDEQLMKLSFAEGYFYGQDRKTNRKYNAFAIFKDLMTAAIVVGVVVTLWNGTSVRTTLLGNNNYEVPPNTINVKFEDVKGCDEAKQELNDVVNFLRNPKKFEALGGKLPRGVILVGPPGTGKTLLARAVAGEAGVPFLQASGSEFDELLVGQGARRVRDLFNQAKAKAPCVVFVDEIDSVGGKRSSSMLHPYANQTINQLLSEMDGFNQNEGVIVLGATNRVEDLDKALLRPGRFDVQVTVPEPDYLGRKELLEHYLSKVRATSEIDLDKLSRTTVGFTGADIENLVNQAALKAATDDMRFVTQSTLEWSRDKIIMGPERKKLYRDKEASLSTAYHESGHALVAYFNEKANNLHKVTIIARGQSGGHTSTLPDKDIHCQTKEQLAATMDVLLGGRVAEEIIYGADRVTTGCSDDLRKANAIANHMVKDYGMSEKVGMRVIRNDQSESRSGIELSKFPDATSELVESEISRLLEESKERVRNLLTEHMTELKLLAEALVKYETLDSEEVKSVFEGKDPKLIVQERELKRKQAAQRKLRPGAAPDRLPLDNLLK